MSRAEKRARVKPNNDLEPKRAELRAKPSLILSPGLVKAVQAALIKSVGGKLISLSSHAKRIKSNMLAPRRLNSAHVEMLTLTSGSSVRDQHFLSAPPEPSPERQSRAEPNRAQNKDSSRAPNKDVPSRTQPRIRPYRGEPSRALSQAELSGEPISANMFCVT